MTFRDEEKILIKSLHLSKGYNASRLLAEFPDKGWTKRSINRLFRGLVQERVYSVSSTPGARFSKLLSTSDKAAANKSSKYYDLAGTHLFFPVAIKTAGTWNQMAVELVQEIGRRITLVTEDSRETVFLFQHLSIAIWSSLSQDVIDDAIDQWLVRLQVSKSKVKVKREFI